MNGEKEGRGSPIPGLVAVDVPVPGPGRVKGERSVRAETLGRGRLQRADRAGAPPPLRASRRRVAGPKCGRQFLAVSV